jgi:hypothetical protein
MPEAVFCRKIKLMNKILRPNYTSTGNVYQLVIPMDIGDMIPGSIDKVNATRPEEKGCVYSHKLAIAFTLTNKSTSD